MLRSRDRAPGAGAESGRHVGAPPSSSRGGPAIRSIPALIAALERDEPMAAYEALIPVNLITGFLGSGKTTLLNRLLRSPQLANTAVLVNEFGEVGLDHLLLETVDAETVILQSGCVCCTIRGDLADAMRGLFSKRERGVDPALRAPGDRDHRARRSGADRRRPCWPSR